MDIFLLPLLNVPQEFFITMSERELRIVNKWNDSLEGGWVLDIYDDNTNLPIIMNIPLITGANLLEQYEYLNLVGALYVFTDGDETAVPTLANLGIESNVYYVVEGA